MAIEMIHFRQFCGHKRNNICLYKLGRQGSLAIQPKLFQLCLVLLCILQHGSNVEHGSTILRNRSISSIGVSIGPATGEEECLIKCPPLSTAKPPTKPDDPSQCGMIALFPTTDKCWKRFENVTQHEELCDKNFGKLKYKDLSTDRFTGAECYCNEQSRGDGYNCQSRCTPNQTTTLTCASGMFCDVDKDNVPYCSCPMGYQKGATGACEAVPNACDTCKHFCHVASKCMNIPSGEWLFDCEPCRVDLGYTGTGKSCKNVNECTAETHNCDPRATCVDKVPIDDDDHYKYICTCPPGWRHNPHAGTTCTPCEDNNECEEKPGICGQYANCENTLGSYNCHCKPGFKKDSEGKCIDDDECQKIDICPKFSKCNNTIGSYECPCINGYKKITNGECEPDPEFFCKDCDKNTTECKLASSKDSYLCECKKFHDRIDTRSCRPITYCDKADKNNCAPAPRGICTDKPDGTGFTCDCAQGYNGDGINCSAISICERERPCLLVSNTRCQDDDKEPNEKYTCPCLDGYVRQLADQDNNKAPCYPIESTVVNNCTLCDQDTEKCIKVEGDKSGQLRTCVCKDGYSKGPNGRCVDTNECCIPGAHNCDDQCAVCINKVPHMDNGAKYDCEVKQGWKGNGTIGTCADIVECEDEKTCPGMYRECHNTIGSYKCPCLPGFIAIPGVQDCTNDNECTRGNYTCNDYSNCNDTIGSYECVCSPGFKESSIDVNGKVVCVDIDECEEGLNATETKACNGKQMCLNTKGGHDCVCAPGYQKCDSSYKTCKDDCKDIDECKERLDNCDPATTLCKNKDGSYECECLSGYERHPEKNNTCVDINECTSTVKPHKCNPHSTCSNVPGSYKCTCDEGYEPEPDSHQMRPFCKRIDVCKTMKDQRFCGTCINTDTAPFYRCECLPGSVNYNATICINPSFCDNDSAQTPEFVCPDKSICKNQRCTCERNYDWVRIDAPLTVEKIKNRVGCKPTSWCDKYTCPENGKCFDTAPAQGECRCNDGFWLDETLNTCLDINECYNATVQCPPNSVCKNLIGSYMCECKTGYSQTSQASDKRTNPVCENINECTHRMDNCTSYENTKCNDRVPGFTCDCIDGYARNQSLTCIGEKCTAAECEDIDECREKTHDCDVNADCKNTPGSYKCTCKKGYFGNGKTCADIDECERQTDDCDRATQDCVNMAGTFNCTCKKGYTLGASGKCEDINECLVPALNNCTTEHKLFCENTPGSYYCKCDTGYVKDLDNICKDINECLEPTACPQGNGDKCVNTDGDYKCQCLSGYRKADHCENKPKTCPCVDIKECEEGIMRDGNQVPACGKAANCTELEGAFKCTCKTGYEGDPYEECLEIDLCKKFPCDEETQICSVINGAPVCTCKENYVQAAGKCIKNPCFEKNGGCGSGAMCMVYNNTGETRCNCQSGYILDEQKNCINEDVCKCGDKDYPCRSEVCDDKDLQMCHKSGSKALCRCDKGYEFDEKTKKCIDEDECEHDPCPSVGNCTNTIGSYFCTCPRGQRMVGAECVVDPKCTNEKYCREDPNASCKKVGEDKEYCVCNQGYKGTGHPADPKCELIDPCEQKKTDTGKEPCPGAHEYSAVIMQQCVCNCDVGFKRIGNDCIDVDECKEQLFNCNRTYECNNTVGSYDCVCPKYYEAKVLGGPCEKIDKCEGFPCNNVTETCDWRTGECPCKSPEFVFLAQNKTCVDRDECKDNAYNCPRYSTCNNTYGGYECICFEGYHKVGDQCVDDDECQKKICNETYSDCVNLPGSYRCECKDGYLQNGPFDCLRNTTDIDVCSKCARNAHCLAGFDNTAFNCTCNDGFRGDGRDNCTNIDECEEGTDNCHEFAYCIDEIPAYSCQCREPRFGDGKNECKLPDLCKTKYNDCPVEAQCTALTKEDSNGKWVTCNCSQLGFRFDPVKRECVDINECDECKDYANCPCPTVAKCNNTEGSFNCACPKGFEYNVKTNTCDDTNECKTGEFQDKCVPGRGKCNNTVGSWNCDCEAGYKNSQNDIQICEKDIYCNIKDDCDRETTICVDEPVGFKCDCLSGLIYIPGSEKKCEDRNECKDGSHNCSTDGSELCINTYTSFVCNCTNGFTKDTKEKCSPDNKCSEDDSKELNCGEYSLCVMLPSKEGKPAPTCICETGYYRPANESLCVVVPHCKNDYDCPHNSKCQVVQAQNGTGEIGTYKCECNLGYQMKGHQCFPVEPCQTIGICGEGSCQELLLPPFYQCICAAGTKQENHTAACKPITCESIVCGPNAECKNSTLGGIHCDCKDGFVGVGTMSSPCTQVDPCKTVTPCSRYATCTSSGSSYKCECNKGYTGNGTWCTNINECKDPALNNCDDKAYCTDTQGSHTCTCKEGYSGQGINGTCENIVECLNPILNQCDPSTTKCDDTEGSYTCSCIDGYEREESAYSCVNINECKNETICDIHTCYDTVGDYKCICKEGYETVPGTDEKQCRDTDECKLPKPVCHVNARCENTLGSYTCTCKEGYTGDGNVECELLDKCQNKTTNDCEEATTKCVMLSDKPAYKCECLDGFVEKMGVKNECDDIDECEDPNTPYDRESVNCVNKPGTYELKCKDLYEEEYRSTDGKNISCVDKDECAMDAGYLETLKKVENGENIGDWKIWMVPPKDNNSAYSICYYDAMQGIQFDDANNDPKERELAILPFCKNLSPNNITKQLRFDHRLKGFECTCAPPAEPKFYAFLEKKYAYTCPASGCREECRTQYNYECVNTECVCKQGFTERMVDKIAQCTDRECGNGETLPEGFTPGSQVNMRCNDNGRYEANVGYELKRHNGTGVVYDVVDIDECELDPGRCCDAGANCTGNDCIMCMNTPGSFSCKSKTVTCEESSIDKQACVCKELPCPRTTAWYFGCGGQTNVTGLGEDRRVCSRIVDGSKYKEFPSEKAMFEFASSKRCDCCFLDQQPEDFTMNTVFNYYGPCLAKERISEAVCPEGSTAGTDDTLSVVCSIRAPPGSSPTIRVDQSITETSTISDPDMCSVIEGKKMIGMKDGEIGYF